MFARSITDPDSEPNDRTPVPALLGGPSGRKITLTETSDFIAVEPSPIAPRRRFALLVFAGSEAQVRLLEPGAAAIVGREPPCEIVIRDPSISRQHARFSLKEGDVWVEDLDSRNGTLWRGNTTQRQKLEPGDQVQLGLARVVLVATQPSEGREGEPQKELGESDYLIHNALMRKLYEHVARVAKTNVPVLVLGETGSGKEHVAGALHRYSGRSSGPFVAANCAAIPPSLFEATLFGHERGAFTGAVARGVGVFERAHGGTLFLDEIGELSSTAQAALLRAVESGRITRVGSSSEFPVDVRLVAATHCDLDAMVEDGTFRKDLFFRLNGVRLSVPPLRDRTDEIELFVRMFVERTRREWGVRARSVAQDALNVLTEYAWPGNVRQLRHAIERAALLCSGDVIRVADLPEYIFARAAAPRETPRLVESLSDLSLREQISKFEQLLVEEALRRTGGNRRAAAKLLRIPVRTLFRKLRVASGSGDGEAKAP